jgi:hypothetical protein
VLVRLDATGERLTGITVEVRRGATLLARSRAVTVGEATREIVLRRAEGRRLPLGAVSLVVRRDGRVLARRTVRLGRS